MEAIKLGEEENNKYDKGYKELLSKKKNFIQLIRNFIDEDWVEDINDEKLEKIDKEFVSPEFSKNESDIVYKLQTEEEEIIFYCLLELQSSVDFTMPFRLLAYMVELLRDIYRNRDKKERERKSFRFPAIVPIVLYNGEYNWTAIRNFKELFNNYSHFGNHLIDFNYILVDVNRYSKGKLLKMANVISTIFYLDQKQTDDLMEKLEELMDCLKNMKEDEYNDIKRWLKKVSDARLSKEEEKEFKEIIEDSKPWEVEKMINNFHKSLGDIKEKAEQKGVEKGIRKARKEARVEKINMVKNLLKQGATIEMIANASAMSEKEVREIYKKMQH